MTDGSREQLKEQIRRVKAEFDDAVAESRRLYAKLEKLKGPRQKIKSGRPSIWKGHEGGYLVLAVEEILAKHKENGRRPSLADAIRWAVKTDPVLQRTKAICRLTDRALQARYQQAADYWSKSRSDPLYRDLDASYKRAADAFGRLLSLEAAFDAI